MSLECPHCQKLPRRLGERMLPVAFQCHWCKHWIRQVGGQFLKWSDWKALLPRVHDLLKSRERSNTLPAGKI